MATDQPGKLNSWQLKSVLTVLLTGQLLSALDQTVVGTTLPTLVGRIGGLDKLTLVMTVYLATSTVAAPLYGSLADRYGPKSAYLASIGLFTAGSLAVGLSGNIVELTLFRALQGLGAGGLVVLAFTISATVVPPRLLGRIQGLVGAMYALASLVGPLVGGAFTQYLSWRWCFLINVPIGLASLAAVALQLRLPAVARSERRVDYRGAGLLTAAVSALLVAAVLGGSTLSWTSPQVLALLAGAAVLAVAFVVNERRAAQPLLPLHLFRKPEIGLAMAITFVVGTAMFGAFVFLPLYLQVVRGDGPTTGGLQLLPLMIAVMAGSGLSGWLIAVVLGRTKRVVLLGIATMTVSLYLFSRLDAGTPRWELWLFEAVMGAGMGMVVSKLIILVQNSAGRSEIGTITAQAAFFRIIGAAIGTAVFGAVLEGRLRHWRGQLFGGGAGSLPNGQQVVFQNPQAVRALAATDPEAHRRVVDAFAHSLQSVFLVAVPVMLIAFALALFLPDTQLSAAGGHRAAAHPHTDEPEGIPTP
ncbi:MDR family MFS transporter [Kitasatospora viridis]|uniref:EmrB/QacA subfamily drug resistance transporter n=1 Tax=Kitasatospora viridis TaxID=281105 RepID=A0A561UCG3_9ACTN|nr:MDR family MFS transporter [Kitasatospora viridis]TWF97040.1 EmrB/QacA subfamily drug resistance transporter [Kitasatospora viridis]